MRQPIDVATRVSHAVSTLRFDNVDARTKRLRAGLGNDESRGTFDLANSFDL